VVAVNFTERLAWKGDEFMLDGIRFCAKGAHEPGALNAADGFLLYKSRHLIEEFGRFWLTRPGFKATNVFELGVWEGGGTVFWFEWLQPDKHVAVDALQREDSPHFRRYVDERGLDDRIRTYWGIDQADSEKLRQIAALEFSGQPLDLVIDDASHELERTRASYETLFPLLRQGGLYVIEDWNWGLVSAFAQDPANTWAATRTPPTSMIVELVEEVGGGGKADVTCLTVFRNFVVIEKR
jgi:cephalosporin hydroxylase